MKKIELTKGYVAWVDDEDYEAVSRYKWFASVQENTVYAKRSVRNPNGKRTTQKLHRFLLDPADGVLVDHIDGNGLNNTRSNLRLATNSENNCNSRKRSNNTSGYIGVYRNRQCAKWQAQIRIDGKSKHLGLFVCPVEAAKARDKAAIEYHGEFASLNFAA